MPNDECPMTKEIRMNKQVRNQLEESSPSPRPSPPGEGESLAICKRNHYPVSSGVQPQLRGSEGQTNSEPYSGRSGSSFGLRHSFGVRHLAFVIVPAIALTYLYAQQDRPDYPRTRATASIGTNRVKITVTGGQRVIEANGWPDHQPGQFPNQG